MFIATNTALYFHLETRGETLTSADEAARARTPHTLDAPPGAVHTGTAFDLDVVPCRNVRQGGYSQSVWIQSVSVGNVSQC